MIISVAMAVGFALGLGVGGIVIRIMEYRKIRQSQTLADKWYGDTKDKDKWQSSDG